MASSRGTSPTVEDVARATVAALQLSGYHILNVGGGRSPTSLLSVIAFMEERLGKKAQIEYKPFPRADILHTQADISRTTALLGWRLKWTSGRGFSAPLIGTWPIGTCWIRLPLP